MGKKKKRKRENEAYPWQAFDPRLKSIHDISLENKLLSDSFLDCVIILCKAKKKNKQKTLKIIIITTFDMTHAFCYIPHVGKFATVEMGNKRTTE